MINKKGPSVIVFDVNETLLDITTLEPLFKRMFGNPALLREWFAQLVLYSQTMTLSGLYTPFNKLGAAALKMTASIHQIACTDNDLEELGDRMRRMPAHPDVASALTRLKNAGYRMVTLTNSPVSASPTPLEEAGLSDYFERTFSVEVTGKFKPAPETYQYVARELSVETSELCLVACHLWDTIGAQAAGCQGAFLARPYNAFLPAPGVPHPDFMASDLTELAEQIINAEL
ncbi:haloacid dehalogenase type II [Marinobacter litoralis]|uniref:haloacid dehalogenase type II n=1 Tax=Marinobacter litoralis TaxID=187981 RepID=UPI0018EC222F|nr:haloacid dehalogenase type II [Marinobacter litoralis]MBJ6138840.1 haloacid dehalogenase type II [Marinobacter litoralis]